MTTTNDPPTAQAAALATFPLFGGTAPAQYGIVGAAEVGPLLKSLGDGTDLASVWTEFIDLLDLWNKDRIALTDLLAFRTTKSGEAVPQNVSPALFEKATELGVSRAAGLPGDALMLGYKFDDYDLATRFTYRFLRSADVRQVRAIMSNIVTGDTTLTTGEILKRIFTPTEQRNAEGFRVFGLYNGTDGITPPPYMGRTFSDTDSHYVASGAAEIDSADVEDAIRLITRKGFSAETGATILVLVNPDEAESIMSWRQGQPSRASGPEAKWDFIPSVSQPAFITPTGELVGEQVPGEFHTIPVLGSYGEARVIQSDHIPSGYFLTVASYGPNSERNVVGFREFPDALQQGLRLIPGNYLGYPLLESFATRAFGVGVRRRGAAVATQITPDPEYTAPTFITSR